METRNIKINSWEKKNNFQNCRHEHLMSVPGNMLEMFDGFTRWEKNTVSTKIKLVLLNYLHEYRIIAVTLKKIYGQSHLKGLM